MTTILSIDESQSRAARVVGFVYLFAMATSIFAEGYVRSQLVVSNDAVETARNIMAHERLFRLGIASYLACLASDVALIAALYVILKRVNQNLAMFAVLMRVVETAMGAASLLDSFTALRLLSGSDYLQVFGADQLAALARIPISVHSAGLNLGFAFFGFGSAVFGYLWFKSSYIPKALAALGVFGSLWLAAGSFAFIIFPKLPSFAQPVFFAPIFLFELSMGVLLLFKALPIGKREA